MCICNVQTRSKTHVSYVRCDGPLPESALPCFRFTDHHYHETVSVQLAEPNSLSITFKWSVEIDFAALSNCAQRTDRREQRQWNGITAAVSDFASWKNKKKTAPLSHLQLSFNISYFAHVQFFPQTLTESRGTLVATACIRCEAYTKRAVASQETYWSQTVEKHNLFEIYLPVPYTDVTDRFRDIEDCKCVSYSLENTEIPKVSFAPRHRR